MSVITPAKPDQADLEALTAVRDTLQGSGGLLYGQYFHFVSGVPCYCIVGAIRQVVFGTSDWKTIGYKGERAGEVRHLSSLIAETIPLFDPAGEKQLQAQIETEYSDPRDKVEGMNRIFTYNDHVLYSLTVDDNMPADPDANARIKAIGLLDTTIARCQELI